MEQLLERLVKRIKPRNGMVVNAETWARAHDFHYDHQRAHLLLGHGAGIVGGLEVVADSQGRRVWIQPGLAIDARGHLIVLARQESLVVGTEQPGLKYIYFEGETEREVGLDPELSRQTATDLQTGYRLVEGFTLPAGAIELARVRINKPNEPIWAAGDAVQPRFHELDQRFRQHISVPMSPIVGVAIVYLGQNIEPGDKYGRRAGQLAGALSHLTQYRVWFDDDLSTTDDFSVYTLLYIVERGAYVLDRTFAAALQTHRDRGGTILVDNNSDDSPLLADFGSQKLQFKPELDAALLTDPFLFGQAPEGANKAGKIWFADSLIISTRHYSPLWQHRPDWSREAIRSATEWAANLVTYALKRKNSSEVGDG